MRIKDLVYEQQNMDSDIWGLFAWGRTVVSETTTSGEQHDAFLVFSGNFLDVRHVLSHLRFHLFENPFRVCSVFRKLLDSSGSASRGSFDEEPLPLSLSSTAGPTP